MHLPKQDAPSVRRIITNFGAITLLRARYVRQHFSRHAHEDFPVGVIEDGALGFDYRGERVVAPPGSINLANPGEPHNGHALRESGWTYRMFYLDVGMMRRIASEIKGEPADIPFFASGVLHDPALAAELRDLHVACESGEFGQLEVETRLLLTLSRFILRHADSHPQPRGIGAEPHAIRRAKAYIDANYQQDITLNDLSNAAFLSPFHLARVFQQATGLPPHVYLIQRRIARAKELLLQGWSLTEVAYELGFVDQSHFHRHFKRIVGITPGEYRRAVYAA